MIGGAVWCHLLRGKCLHSRPLKHVLPLYARLVSTVFAELPAVSKTGRTIRTDQGPRTSSVLGDIRRYVGAGTGVAAPIPSHTTYDTQRSRAVYYPSAGFRKMG